MFQLPWTVVGPAMALAVVATYFAASRPAPPITRLPVVAALSGRPAPPKQVHRSALPGVVFLVIAFLLLATPARPAADAVPELAARDRRPDSRP